MNDFAFGAGETLQPAYDIDFNVPGSLARTMTQPLVVNNPVGLVICGDSSALYLAHVPDPGSSPYNKLPILKAQTYIHGWTVNAGKLYVLDGIEISAYDLLNGKLFAKYDLITDPRDAAEATARLRDLRDHIQRLEWAKLLEQAEDEYLRITAEQRAAPAGSTQRASLDQLAKDFLKMLSELRTVLGGTTCSANPRGFIEGLRNRLDELRYLNAKWLFSAPMIRRSSLQQPERAVFIMQGDGTLHYLDKGLSESGRKNWNNVAETQLLLVEDSAEQLAFISSRTLYVIDATTLDEISHWQAPDVAMDKITLAAGNGRFWWATPRHIFVLELNASEDLVLTSKVGAPFTPHQVGRHPVPPTPYEPPVNPNDLFDTMNVRAWIAKRANQSADLNPGMMAHLLLTDDKNKYQSPPDGTSYILALPWSSDEIYYWDDVKVHPRSPLVLLSDTRGLHLQCRYPFSPGGPNQKLVPHWATGSWVFTTAPGSPNDQRLCQAWPTPAVRPLTKPKPDMIGSLYDGNPDTKAIADLTKITSDGHIRDRHLRYIIWFAVLGFDTLYVEIPWRPGRYDSKPSVFPRWCVEHFDLKNTWPPYSQFGNVFRFQSQEASKQSFRSAKIPVNFDPPWNWPNSGPPMDLFHSTPPAWYDPWGYNRPGDFETTQPPPTYLAPFCFDGQLKFPVRQVQLDVPKGRAFSVFTDNDPASVLASAPPPNENAANKENADDVEPELLEASAEPNTLTMITDDYLHLTILQLLQPVPLRITYNTASHKFEHEAPALGITRSLVIGPPVVFLNRKKIFPVAWCPVQTDSPSARLRKLASFDPETGDVPWETWFNTNKAEYGSSLPNHGWNIASCPLPSVALPTMMVHGYGLPPVKI